MIDTSLPRSEPNTTCPFCKDPLAGAKSLRCSVCDTLHHLSCFKAHGKCSVFGCSGVYLSFSSARSWLKRAFYIFLGAILARALFFGFVIGISGSYIDPGSRQILRVLFYCFSGVFLLTYGFFAVAAVRAARALQKDPTSYIAFFACLPVIQYLISLANNTVIGLIGYVVTASPIAVYLLLSREMEDEAQDLSLFHR